MATSAPKLTISLVGTTPLFRRDKLDPILAVLEAELAPETWSLGEKAGAPYARAKVLAKLEETGEKPLSGVVLVLKRKKAPAYEVMLPLGPKPAILFETKAAAKDHPALFALADQLADVFDPDWGAAHVWIGMLDGPFKNDDDRDAELMFRAASLLPATYYKYGPMGLGMRTYIGPHYVRQLGAKLIDKLPVLVKKTSWGGYKIDLVEKPWAQDLATVLTAWRAGMKPLREANLLATPKVAKGEFVERVKSPELDVGGVVA